MTQVSYEQKLAELKKQMDAQQKLFEDQQARLQARLAEQEALLDLYRMSAPAQLDYSARI